MQKKDSGAVCRSMVVLIAIAAILAAIMPAQVVANPAVVVDGAIIGTEWDNPLIAIVDANDPPGTGPEGYNISLLNVTIENNTLYCLFVVFGVAGDADDNGDSDTEVDPINPPVTDCPGIGAGYKIGWEERIQSLY
jgi:hypothetical protein